MQLARYLHGILVTSIITTVNIFIMDSTVDILNAFGRGRHQVCAY